jgi:dihydropteroate synthase
MGVVNVTPDSFSDGGRWFEPEAAIAHGIRLLDEGADVLDIGGESTRPGAQRVPLEEELRRVIPVIRELAAGDAVVSVDTMRAEVADAALAAGAALVNDVSGGMADPSMAALVAEAGVPYIVVHWRAPSAEMESSAVYTDVVTEVRAELQARLEALAEVGVRPEQVALDPGLGFAKNSPHNWALLADLDALHGLGRPLVLGASRKRFLGALLAGPDGEPAPVEDRDFATSAISAFAAAAGVWCVRVHEVRPSADAVRVVEAIGACRQGPAEPEAGGAP